MLRRPLPTTPKTAQRLFAEYATAIKGKHTLSHLGTARTSKAAIALDREEEAPSRDEVERLGTISVDGWNAVVKGRLREAVAQVATREELVALVLRAACIAGYKSIPAGWLTLAPATKTVIGVKSIPTLVSSLGGMPA